MGNVIKKAFIGLIFLVTGCEFIEHRQYHDPALKLQKSDFQRITQPPSSSVSSSFSPKPSSSKPLPPLTDPMKKPVTLNVNERVPLKDIFMELSRQTGVGLALAPQLSHERVVYSAQKQPCIQVIKDLCEMSGNRFQIRDNLIRIEADDPYLQTYKLESLSNTRTSENRMSITTDVFTVMENNKSRADNGSDSLLTGNTKSDFWQELEKNLQMILFDPGVKGKDSLSPHYTFHKQGGLVTIKANAKQHKRIESYLKQLKETTATQVLIEAKIIEVNLNSEYRSGINWGFLGNNTQLSAAMGDLSTPGALMIPGDLKQNVFTFAVDYKDFASVLNLVNRFGTVRTLSNPRMTVMNNQPAMLKVATNEVFFQLEFDRYFQADGKPDVENFSSNIMTVPIGLVLVVQPSVNHHTGDITMTLRPTVSRIDKFVEDPAVAIKSNQKVKSRIPVVQVREIDSVLRMISGQVLVLGGLMEDRSANITTSIPGTDEVPLFNQLTQGKDDERKVTELVIFLTAHIVDDSFLVGADERLYNVYTEDPRPLGIH